MPRGLRQLRRVTIPAAAGIFAATGLALPGTVSPVVADTAAYRPAHAAPVTWSAELGPVPQATTHTAPALARVSLARKSSRLLIFWTGPKEGLAGFQISYQTSISLRKNVWSAPGKVASGKALTTSRPSAAPIGPDTSGQVIVVWKDAGDSQVRYSIGQAGKGSGLTWSTALPIPGWPPAAVPPCTSR